MKKIYHKWMWVIEKLGNFQAKIIFSLLYIFLMTPFGICISFFCDFLNTRHFPTWKKIEQSVTDLEGMKKQ